MTLIDWSRLARAKDFYAAKGYTYIDVPWWVPAEIAALTRPIGATEYKLDRNGKVLVASAEQSFLYLLSKGQIERGRRYMTVTPCFREETQDTTHRKHFMKLELFEATVMNASIGMQDAAEEFFNSEGLTVEEDPTSMMSADLVCRGVDGSALELGSYGSRSTDALGWWNYGTGCAEPRTSVAKEALARSIAAQAVSQQDTEDAQMNNNNNNLIDVNVSVVYLGDPSTGYVPPPDVELSIAKELEKLETGKNILYLPYFMRVERHVYNGQPKWIVRTGDPASGFTPGDAQITHTRNLLIRFGMAEEDIVFLPYYVSLIVDV